MNVIYDVIGITTLFDGSDRHLNRESIDA